MSGHGTTGGNEGLLLNWPGPDGALTLEQYRRRGGLKALELARKLEPAQLVTRLRDSRLRQRGGTCQPVYQSWWEAVSGPDGGCLLAQPLWPSPNSLAEPHLLSQNPFGLIEGLCVAALATGKTRALLKLPPHLAKYFPRLDRALAELRSAGLIAPKEMNLEPWSSLGDPAGLEPMLGHDLETWYLVVLALAQGPDALLGSGIDGHSGSHLITVSGQVDRPGLYEMAMGAPLAQALKLAGQTTQDPDVTALSLDGGLGGFLPQERTATPLSPEELMAAGVGPCPGGVTVLDASVCLINLTRRALTDIITQGLEPDEASRQLVLHAIRLTTNITMRRGHKEHLEQLEELAQSLGARGSVAAWPLLSSLRYFPVQWLDHLAGRACASYNTLLPAGAPCREGCPAGIDIPAMVALVGHGRYQEAVELIRRDNPLPYICGLVCPAPCEPVCLRGKIDAPISIRAMKAVAARHCLAHGGYPQPEKDRPSGKRLAVVGAGPAGLSAAYYSALRGHEVTIFEAASKPGGTMLMGIPAYRLPREVIAAEVEAITDIGVKLVLDKALGRDFSLDDLREDGFDTVYLGIGAHQGYKLRIPGEDDYPQVLDGISFLRQVSMDGAGAPGDEVVVVGGGNAAMDAARTCVRLGCSQVTIAYRRTRKEMPAHEEEIEAALQEGVKLSLLTVPAKVAGEGGVVSGLVCLRAELGPPDDSGRRRPVPVDGSEFTMGAQAVIAAIGQQPNISCLGMLGEDQRFCGRWLKADETTGKSYLPWLFAGGDAVTGPATVVQAVAAGKRAAGAMDAFLRGMPPELGIALPAPETKVEPLVTNPQMRLGSGKAHPPTRPVAQRIADFGAVEGVLSSEAASLEAMRCLRCDICLGCGLCETACAEMGAHALHLAPTGLERGVFLDFTGSRQSCLGCGACANACPTGAIRVEDVGDKRRIIMTGTVLGEVDLLPCSVCGKPYAPRAYLDELEKRLQAEGRPDLRVHQRICPECGRQGQARQRHATNMFATMPGPASPMDFGR